MNLRKAWVVLALLCLMQPLSCSRDSGPHPSPTGSDAKPQERMFEITPLVDSGTQSQEKIILVETKDGKPVSSRELMGLSRTNLLKYLGEPKDKREVRNEEAGTQEEIWIYSVSKGPWTFLIIEVSLQRNRVAEIRSREVFTCIAEGTSVHSYEGVMPIEAVRVGDRVRAYDFDKAEVVSATVTAVRAYVAHETVIINDTLEVTPIHPVYTRKGWKRAAEVTCSDMLMDSDGGYARACRIRFIANKTKVYDVSVDGPHNFFAGGVLVHNKTIKYIK